MFMIYKFMMYILKNAIVITNQSFINIKTNFMKKTLWISIFKFDGSDFIYYKNSHNLLWKITCQSDCALRPKI